MWPFTFTEILAVTASGAVWVTEEVVWFDSVPEADPGTGRLTLQLTPFFAASLATLEVKFTDRFLIDGLCEEGTRLTETGGGGVESRASQPERKATRLKLKLDGIARLLRCLPPKSHQNLLQIDRRKSTFNLCCQERHSFAKVSCGTLWSVT